jgi:hypothetical protein
MRTFLVGTLLVCCVCGCVAPQQNYSPPVVQISSAVPLNRIKGAIIDTYIAEGWRLERESDHMITFVIENKDALAQFLSSSSYESRVFNRETVTISESGSGVTLRANQEVITNYGSAFERSKPTRGTGARRLDSVRSKLGGAGAQPYNSQQSQSYQRAKDSRYPELPVLNTSPIK